MANEHRMLEQEVRDFVQQLMRRGTLLRQGGVPQDASHLSGRFSWSYRTLGQRSQEICNGVYQIVACRSKVIGAHLDGSDAILELVRISLRVHGNIDPFCLAGEMGSSGAKVQLKGSETLPETSVSVW
jgi:hypothetical protein